MLSRQRGFLIGINPRFWLIEFVPIAFAAGQDGGQRPKILILGFLMGKAHLRIIIWGLNLGRIPLGSAVNQGTALFIRVRYVGELITNLDGRTGGIEMGFWAWHRRQTALWQERLGLDDYQLLWAAVLKGVLLGVLLTLWLA